MGEDGPGVAKDSSLIFQELLMGATYDAEKFRQQFERDFTWLNGFMRNVSRFGHKPAMYDAILDKRWTYAELNADANKLAHAFQSDKAGKNDVVMYMLLNSPEFALSYIATHKAGAISCPINFRLAEGEVALLIEDSKPEIFIFGEEFAPVARKALKLSRHKPKRVILAGKNPEKGETGFEAYMATQPDSNPQLDWQPTAYDEKLRLYTSGTTNTAKGVPLNDINEVLSAHDVIMHFPLNPTDRTMNMTPWFHRGGIHSGGLTPTLYVGAEVIILREFNPKRCLELAQKEKVTFLVGVPSIIALLARQQERQPVDLSSLRGIVTMGSPFDKTSCERYRELLTPNIFNGYGTTETFWNTFLRPYQLPEMAGTAGQACTDDDVRIVALTEDGSHADPDNLVARDNEAIGEIIIKSSYKSPGSYYNNPEMSAAKFHNGFHYTGDLGVWDKNGFVTVVSRKDDMIISAGENIYPAQIESILNSHPKVAESAVVGQPDRLHGQVTAAYVVPSDTSLTIEELRTWCHSHPLLSGFKRPRFYYLQEKLPHTATGKLMHYKIRQQASSKDRDD